MTNEIDWDKAKKNDTHAISRLGSDFGFYELIGEDSQRRFLGDRNTYNVNVINNIDYQLIERPKPLQPVLGGTIKCKQNNKMYTTGCLYEFKDETDSSWELGRLVDIDGRNFRSDTGTKREWYVEIREVSIKTGTITDAPIKLIDGKAYQFDYDSKARIGLASSGLLITIGLNSGKPFNVELISATNIKLLEVKS